MTRVPANRRPRQRAADGVAEPSIPLLAVLEAFAQEYASARASGGEPGREPRLSAYIMRYPRYAAVRRGAGR